MQRTARIAAAPHVLAAQVSPGNCRVIRASDRAILTGYIPSIDAARKAWHAFERQEGREELARQLAEWNPEVDISEVEVKWLNLLETRPWDEVIDILNLG